MKGKRKSGGVQSSGKMISSLLERGSSVIALGSIVSIAVATALKVKPLTPLLIAAVIAPFLIERLRNDDLRGALRHVFNWAMSTFIFCAIVSVFIPARAKEAFPYAQNVLDAFLGWIRDPAFGSPYGFKIAVLGAIAVFIASSLSWGIGGLIILAGSLCSAAFAFAYVARHADNLIHIALIGIPPWEIAAFLAAFFFIVPSASLSLRKFKHKESSSGSQREMRLYIWIGISLVAFSALASIVLGDFWAKLTGNCTVL